MILEKFADCFARPSEFFKHVDKEKTYTPALMQYVIFLLPVIILESLQGAPEFGMLGVLMGLFFGLVMLFVGPFIGAAISHIGVLLVGGKQGYLATFKGLVYSQAAVAVYYIFASLLGGFALLVGEAAVIGVGVVSVIIYVIAFVHSAVLVTIGVAHLHKISKIRAFVGAIVLPTAAVMLIAGIFAVMIAAFLMPVLVASSLG